MQILGQDSLENENNPVNTKAKSRQVGSDYKFQSSEYIISELKRRGFNLVGTSTGKPNKPENRGYQKHMMVFDSSFDVFRIDDNNRLRILVQNSHDGNSAVKFYVGVYRAVCANGLICGDTQNYIKVSHRGNDFEKRISAAIDDTMHQFSETKYKVRYMKHLHLNTTQRETLAIKMERHLMKDKGRWYSFATERLLKRNRKDDKENDLYTIFNVIQENALKGGIYYQKVDEQGDGAQLKTRKTRAIKENSPRSVELNKFLWQEALKLVANDLSW